MDLMIGIVIGAAIGYTSPWLVKLVWNFVSDKISKLKSDSEQK